MPDIEVVQIQEILLRFLSKLFSSFVFHLKFINLLRNLELFDEEVLDHELFVDSVPNFLRSIELKVVDTTLLRLNDNHLIVEISVNGEVAHYLEDLSE